MGDPLMQKNMDSTAKTARAGKLRVEPCLTRKFTLD